MPSKSKASGKPKAKGTPKVKPADKKKAAKGYKAADVDDGSVAEAALVAKNPRRQLERRETDEQFERIKDRKLSFVPIEVFSTKVDTDGISAKDCIMAEVRRNKITKSRLSTKFWVGFWEKYDFGDVLADTLPCPPEADVVDSELLEAIGVARQDNPIERNPDELVRYLRNCKGMNERSYFGVLTTMQEGPTLGHKHAVRIQVAVLELIGRTRSVAS
jgi:hypothetical protein